MADRQIVCKHDWRILTNDHHDKPGVSICDKCDLWLFHSNRLQLEMNEYNNNFHKKQSILTIVISISALLVSIAVAIFK